MKKIGIVLTVILVLLLFCSGCGGNPKAALTEKTRIIEAGLAAEVLPGVFDDGINAVYISIENNDNAYAAVADYLARKQAWEKMFPQKEIFTAASIADPGRSNVTGGIVIHYRTMK